MSSPLPCAPSCPPVIQNTQIPGVQGLAGQNGTSGTNGVNAFTTTTADFTVPVTNSNVTISVVNSSWAVVGQILVVGQGVGTAIADPGPMNGQVVSIPSATSIQLKALGYPGDVTSGTVIGSGTGSGGAIVSPAGQQQASPVGIASGGTGQITAAAAMKALGGRYRLLGSLIGANMAVTTDQAIAGMPSKYVVKEIIATNASTDFSGGTVPLGGLYTAATKGGTAFVAAGQSYVALTGSTIWLELTIAAAAISGTAVLTATTVYFSLSTAHASGTADFYIFGYDLT